MTKNIKNALVLGSIKGIGKAISLELAKNDINVAMTYFDWEEHLQQLKDDFAPFGSNHIIQKVNLLDIDEIGLLIEHVRSEFGGLDILINNIERGGWPLVHGPYVQEQWDMEVATTLRAKRWVFTKALPLLKKSGNGVVINISSIAGLIGRAGPAANFFNDAYSAVNRGVSLLTETWAREAAPEVRVNELMLGFIETRHGPETRGWTHLKNSEKQALIDHTLLGRVGKISDVVETVMFLVNQANFLTGSVIRIDGGYLLGGEKVPPMPKGIL